MEEQLISGYQRSWHDTNIRWLALALACILQSGNYYCYDFPAVLADQIQSQFDVDSFQYNLLYTLYSSPNIVLPLIGGILIDYSGFKVACIGFNVALLLGQGYNTLLILIGLCLIGSVTNKYYLLLIGRVLYGLGGENMSVLQTTITSKWFNGREMAFALGLNVTVARIGSILNSAISPQLEAINGNISIPLFAGFCFLVLSAIASIILLYIDTLSDKRDLAYQLEEVITEKIELKDCKQFKIDLYMVVLSCMLCYSNLFVFQQNNISMFSTMFGLSNSQANIMYQIPYYTGAALTPFMGLLIDKVGGRPFFLIIASFLILFVDLWYLFVPSCSETCWLYPITGQLVLALFYTFYAAVLWPVVPLCVPPNTVGTAFGITNSVQNVYYFLLIGRFIYGLGGENMNVLQATMTSKWFKGKEMAFAFGYINLVIRVISINLTFARFGSIMGSIITPKLQEINGNITLPLIAGLFFLILSAIAGLILFYIDSESDKRDLAEQLEGLIVEKIQLKDCKEFKLDLYLVVIGSVLCYSSFLGFQQNDLKMFKVLYQTKIEIMIRFALTQDQANYFYQVPYYVGAVLTPPMGLLIDKIGRRTFFLILSSLLLLITDVLYLVAPTCNQACYTYPITGQLLICFLIFIHLSLACFYTIYAAALWALIPLCVPQHTVGTAFGITNSTQNLGFTTFPLMIGLLTNSATVQSYRNMMMFFSGVGILALINHIILKFYDKYKLKGRLSKNFQETDKTHDCREENGLGE